MLFRLAGSTDFRPRLCGIPAPGSAPAIEALEKAEKLAEYWCNGFDPPPDGSE